MFQDLVLESPHHKGEGLKKTYIYFVYLVRIGIFWGFLHQFQILREYAIKSSELQIWALLEHYSSSPDEILTLSYTLFIEVKNESLGRDSLPRDSFLLQ